MPPSPGVWLSRCCAYQGSFLKSSKSVVNSLSISAKVPVFQGFSEIIKVVIAKHNQQVEAYDGTYQIDVLAEFTALRSRIKVLVECKKLTRAVDRDKAMLLHGKLQSIGANKGILISTTGFQRGAVQYAKMHGLTLWQLCDRSIRHVVASGHQEISENVKMELLAEQYLPKYFVMAWDCDLDYPYDRIYPTKEMYKAAIEKVKENYRD